MYDQVNVNSNAQITTCDITNNDTAGFLEKVAVRNTQPPWNSVSQPAGPVFTNILKFFFKTSNYEASMMLLTFHVTTSFNVCNI